MNVSMMQPSFIPWLGYFELMLNADVFILLDDFQFSVQSWHQRNRLFVNKDTVDWYTVPVDKKRAYGNPLNQAAVNERQPWRQKMWKRLVQNYSRADHFKELAPHVEHWLLQDQDTLAALNIDFIVMVSKFLGYRGDIRFSSRSPSPEKRSKRVMTLLRQFDATRYFCARGSFPYMWEEGVFPDQGIDVAFQDFHSAAYPQIGATSGFVPCLSALDALFNVGGEKTRELVLAGTPAWTNWDEMERTHTAQLTKTMEAPA